MKPYLISSISVALCTAVFAAVSRAQSGGQFDLAWSAIGGGGGSSSGGQFTLHGTIGQPDAGTLAGGPFKLEGGFWSGITLLQTPGAPILKIKLIGGGKAVLSWPVSVQGFSLECCDKVASGAWSGEGNVVIDTATEHTVTVPANAVMKCYRLGHP